MINVTSYIPYELNKWLGFCKYEVLAIPDKGSPKSQYHEIIFPGPIGDEASSKSTGSFSQASE